jgi:formate dehydrogenase major subunit
MKEINLTIDGKKVTVPEGTTILKAAAQLGITIPTLCFRDGLKPFTSCFLCVVDLEGRPNPVTSCATMVAEGMVVNTQSQRIRETRKMCLELLLSDHCGDCMAPCSLTCPAGCQIQDFIRELKMGHEAVAIRVIKQALPIPASLGRICPRPCEAQCRRVRVEEPLAVCWLHRFAADKDAGGGSIYCPEPGKSTGKKVAVVGAGPAGMAAAYFLRQMGHGVTVFEAEQEMGGMMRWGIPAYRLPREELKHEFEAIVKMGVEMRYGKRLGKDFALADLRKEKFGAIFVAVGSPFSSGMRVKGENLPGVWGGTEFLGRVAHGEKVEVGKHVVVVGGGNTAIDAVRTSRRLGAKVTLLYRRTRAEMPALPIEIHEAEREGTEFRFLAAPMEVTQKNGRLAMRCQQMKLGEPGPDGRRKPVPVEGETFDLEADTIIAAIGQKIEADVFKKEGLPLDKWESAMVVNSRTMQTSIPDVFAGGDLVARDDQRIAVWAVGSGHLAAISIDQYLRGEAVTGRSSTLNVTMGTDVNEIDVLRFAGIDKAARTTMPELEPRERITSFREVELGLTPEMMRTEASRCLACGCGAADDCKVRQYAFEYGADLNRFVGARRNYGVDTSHPEIIYEPGKCILCGICVNMFRDDKTHEVFGFANRGFATRIKPYVREPVNPADSEAIKKCVEACPTGALVLRSELATPVKVGLHCFGCDGNGHGKHGH